MPDWTPDRIAGLKHRLSLPYEYRCSMDKKGYLTVARPSGRTRSGRNRYNWCAGVPTPGVHQAAKMLHECGWYKKNRNSRWWYHDADHLEQKRNHVSSLRRSLELEEANLREMEENK